MTTDDTPTIPELLKQHLDAITEMLPAANVYGSWPDGSDFGEEDGFEAYGSWCFIDGFASALDMTATELLDSYGLILPEKDCVKCRAPLEQPTLAYGEPERCHRCADPE